MKTLLVQDYLRSGKSLDDLRLEHGVKSFITKDKISLNYDQLEASNSDLLASQCRGLVLRDKTYDIVACPFFRFFNYGEGNAANVDFTNCKIYSKVDGTCAIVSFDVNQNKWFMSTRARAEADQKIDNFNYTFSDLTDMAAEAVILDNSEKNLQGLMKNADKDFTYVFELTTPYNEVVISRDKFNLHFLGLRNNLTLMEDFPEDHLHEFSHTSIKIPNTYSFSSLEEVVNFVKNYKVEEVEEYEGVVVRDNLFNRLKIKNDAYNFSNGLRDSIQKSKRSCVGLILRDQVDDLVNKIPEKVLNDLFKMQEEVKDFLKKVDLEYESIKHIKDQKEFAIAASSLTWKGMMFNLRKSDKSIKEYIVSDLDPNKNIKKLNIDVILTNLGYRED